MIKARYCTSLLFWKFLKTPLLKLFLGTELVE